MKPLISYYGGKQRIATTIVRHLQSIRHSVYAEPFAGGLAVLYAKPLPLKVSKHYIEAVNDSGSLLINLYRVIQDQPDSFEALVKRTPYSLEEHRRAVNICKAPEGYTDLRKAWAYYVNIQFSFAHKLNAGWGRSMTGSNQAGCFYNKKTRLPDAMDRLKAVNVDNRDALDFIRAWDTPHTPFLL